MTCRRQVAPPGEAMSKESKVNTVEGNIFAGQKFTFWPEKHIFTGTKVHGIKIRNKIFYILSIFARRKKFTPTQPLSWISWSLYFMNIFPYMVLCRPDINLAGIPTPSKLPFQFQTRLLDRVMIQRYSWQFDACRGNVCLYLNFGCLFFKMEKT